MNRHGSWIKKIFFQAPTLNKTIFSGKEDLIDFEIWKSVTFNDNDHIIQFHIQKLQKLENDLQPTKINNIDNDLLNFASNYRFIKVRKERNEREIYSKYNTKGNFKNKFKLLNLLP